MAAVEKSETAKKEEEVLAFWQEHDIFHKSLTKDAPKGEFTFYDGPPFATGLPHSGSLLSSVAKDLIPRYKTMRGYRVRRRWGWDTHGLPIENLVEKKLGLKNKKEILTIGIEKFNETARSMVLEYVHEWKRYVERVGRFVDFDHSYKTMDNSFIESVWWGLKKIHDQGHLYEGRKVLLYCPHCETPLAKAEIAMDNTYKDVTEEAVTVKFKVKPTQKLLDLGIGQDVYLLAWTTTPWTLPGNVALAVNPEMTYRAVQYESGRYYIVAKERMAALGLSDPNMGREFTGRNLIDLEYEPLYEIEKVKKCPGKKWQVLAADFVTTEEGTGIVHTAVIYGEDDYQLGVKEGLPMVPLLNPNATYNDDAPAFVRGEYIRKAEPKIKEDLETRGLLFAKAAHTHSYPHCYRCGTALIYNAVSSWFINIQAIKQKMLAENEKISWTPAHLKEGRFKHNLETAPDWTISRNRFWASPLPIWKDAEGDITVIGSLEELKARTKKSGNTYFVMRHGEAENNVKGIGTSSLEVSAPYHLTELGRAEVTAAAKRLQGVDMIFVSPIERTRETAEIVANELGLSKTSIVVDDRLHEISLGELDGHPVNEFEALFAGDKDRFMQSAKGGESLAEVRRRMGAFLYDIEARYQGKKILIISHGDPIWMLNMAAAGYNASQIELAPYPKKGEPRAFDFVPLPHNADFELDYHLPYIDRIELVSEAGKPLTRIPEVVDCWVESGSMPFAEYHYPFENKEVFESRSPGDFVSEYIGQTRAWFYYMHAMSVGLFGTLAFKNVITTGNVLAADGMKLSKSKGNYTDPYLLFDQYGADAFRYYIMASVVMQAEDMTFRDEEVREVGRMVNMLRNVLAFYELFATGGGPASGGKGIGSEHVLDRWILARLAETISATTEAFDAYDVPRGARPMKEFIDDLSTWYVRRSRDRMKGGEAAVALETLRHVLKEFSKVIAPVMPFVAEEVFQSVRDTDEPESVHLARWPYSAKATQGKPAWLSNLFGNTTNTALITEMKKVRDLASQGLQLRQKANVKVRQPLASLAIPGELPPELAALLAEELNVKKIVPNAAEIALDAVLTPELVKEGDERAFTRAVAEARKAEGYSQRDAVRAETGETGVYAVELSTGTVRFNLVRDSSRDAR